MDECETIHQWMNAKGLYLSHYSTALRIKWISPHEQCTPNVLFCWIKHGCF